MWQQVSSEVVAFIPASSVVHRLFAKIILNIKVAHFLLDRVYLGPLFCFGALGNGIRYRPTRKCVPIENKKFTAVTNVAAVTQRVTSSAGVLFNDADFSHC